MKRIDQLRKKLADLEAKRNQFMREGKYGQMVAMDKTIKEARLQVEVAEEFELKPIRELMSSEDIIEAKLIHKATKLHIAADYVAEVSYELYDAFAELGYVLHTIIPEFEDLAKQAQKLAGLLIQKAPALTALLVDNDTLLKSIDMKVQSFIDQRIK